MIPLALNGIDGKLNGLAARKCGRAYSKVIGDDILLIIGRARVYIERQHYTKRGF